MTRIPSRPLFLISAESRTDSTSELKRKWLMNPHEPQAAAGGLQTPSELCETGLRCRQAGRRLDAQLCCEQALAQDANHADSLHLMGLLSSDAEQYDHALEWIVRAIKQDLKPEYLSSLGLTLRRQGQYQRAFNAFDKAVQLKPGDPELWKDRGTRWST